MGGAWWLGVRVPRAFFVFQFIRGHGNWTGDGGRRERWEFGNLRFEIRDEGAPEGWEVLTAEITEITEMEMGGRGTFFHESHEFSRMDDERGPRVFIHRFHRFPQMGKRGVLCYLKEAGTVMLLRTICANLCNLWITHSSFSSIREQKGSVNSIELFSRAERMTEFRSNQ